MVQPVKPMEVFLGDRDISAHEKAVSALTEEINVSLRGKLCDEDQRPWVVVSVRDYGRAVVLEVVWRFKQVGWNVMFWSDEVVVGIFSSSTRS